MLLLTCIYQICELWIWFSDFLVQISLSNLSWKYLENIKSWKGANNFEESCKFWTTISNLVIGSAATAGQMSTKVKQTQVWQSRKWSGRGWSSTSIKGWGWCSALSKEANMEPLKERSSNFLQPGGPSERNRRKSFSEGGLQPFPRRKSYVVMMRKLQLCLILTIYQGGSWGQPGASWWWRGRRQTEELGWRRRRCHCSPWRRSWLWWRWPTSRRFLSNIHTCSQGPVEESAKKHTSRIRRGSLLTIGSDVDSQPEKEAKKLKEQVEVIQVQSSAQQVPVPDLLTGISFDTQPYPIQFWKSSGSG